MFQSSRSLGHARLQGRARIKMDVVDTDKTYTVKAEIPSVKQEDIKVDVEGNQVSIVAELKKESEERDGKNGRQIAID